MKMVVTQLSNEQMDKPLHPHELRTKVAEEMWKACRSHADPIEPPPPVYAMAEVAIKVIYINVDKMLMETIKNRLEGLL